MKKILFFMPVIVAVLLLAGCTTPQLFGQFQNFRSGNYVGEEYNGNYIWGGAMNLAWNELNDNILHGKLQLNTADKNVLAIVDKFNNPSVTKDDLDEASYYVKSGFGQETVDIINKESKEKFPNKTFGDLKINLSPHDIISYAYFLKEARYKTPFELWTVNFSGQNVAGFDASNEAERGNVKIIKYENDDKFIISLQLEDNSDQLILAKGYNMADPQAVIKEINKNNVGKLAAMGDSDVFEAPKLQLDYTASGYGNLIGKYLANHGFENYLIASMVENIKFKMDETGAKVESQAIIGSQAELAYIAPITHKNFILDKPYWVVMKRENSQNPYFILGVNNTGFMEKR